MTPRFLDFSGKLQPYEDLFTAINRITSDHNVQIFVVGAFARDLILTMAHGIKVKKTSIAAFKSRAGSNSNNSKPH